MPASAFQAEAARNCDVEARTAIAILTMNGRGMGGMIFALFAAIDKLNATRYFGGEQPWLLVCRSKKQPMNAAGVFAILSRKAINNRRSAERANIKLPPSESDDP